MNGLNQVKRMTQLIQSNQSINSIYILSFLEILYFVGLFWKILYFVVDLFLGKRSISLTFFGERSISLTFLF